MIVAGLTGSIGMGKSTIAAYLRSRGFPVLDADRLVHDLYAEEAAPLIEAAFPGTVREGAVDRAKLALCVLSRETALKKLEAIVHPLVRMRQWRFLEGEHDRGTDLAVLEVPLLFETAPRALFDAILLASAPVEMQRERILRRSGMTLEKFEALSTRQWPDARKRELADYVVDTSGKLGDNFPQIDAILKELLTRPALAYLRWADLYRR
jgi:dephospho-CoA kinase